MPYVTKGNQTLWEPGPDGAGPTQAEITAQMDTSGSAGSDWRDRLEFTSGAGPDSPYSGERLRQKSGGGGPTPAVAALAAPTALSESGGIGGGVVSQPAPSASGGPLAGLQAASPEAPTAGMQISAPGGLRQNLGRRNLPNEISGLRVLTY